MAAHQASGACGLRAVQQRVEGPDSLVGRCWRTPFDKGVSIRRPRPFFQLLRSKDGLNATRHNRHALKAEGRFESLPRSWYFVQQAPVAGDAALDGLAGRAGC